MDNLQIRGERGDCETCLTYRRGIAAAIDANNASLAVDGRVLLRRHVAQAHAKKKAAA